MKIFITGGSGFVGSVLSRHLMEKGHEVIAVGASPGHGLTDQSQFRYIQADTSKPGKWQSDLGGVDAVVNLAGANIFRYWSEAYKEQIYSSRILTTRHLVDALPKGENLIFLSTSAAGFYGDRADEVLKEDASPGTDFLATVCIDWEKEALKAREKGVRTAIMRFGVVLGRQGGALSKMIPAFKLFAGGPLGSGRQWFSWIHLEDLLSSIVLILENQRLAGVFNFSSPHPVRNREFAKTLGRALHKAALVPAPGFLIRMVMGELGGALLSSQRAIPERLEKSGYTFRFPRLDMALADILG